MAEALAVARLANFDQVKLPMDRAQACECVWQEIGALTSYGEHKPQCPIRALARTFASVSRTTITNMVDRAMSMPVGWEQLERHPISNWPTWKAVIVAVRPPKAGRALDPDARRQRRIDDAASRIAIDAKDDDDPKDFIARASERARMFIEEGQEDEETQELTG